jgi:hypothetical protein
LLRAILVEVNLTFPKSGLEAVTSWQWSRYVLRHPKMPKLLGQQSTPLHLQVAFAAAQGLSLVDQIRGFYFHGIHARLAISLESREQLARALAMDGPISAGVDGEPGLANALGQIEKARKLLATDDHTGHALVETTQAMALFVTGHWTEAIEQAELALKRIGETCRGFAWAVATNVQILTWALGYLGRLDELGEIARDGARDALSRADRFGLVPCWAGPATMIPLLRNEPNLATRRYTEALASWSQIGFHVQHLSVLYSEILVCLYSGNRELAWQRLTESEPKIKEAQQLRVEFNRLIWFGLLGRVALMTLSGAPHDKRSLSAVKLAIKNLAKGTSAASKGKAHLLHAQLKFLSGDGGNAEVEHARTCFASAKMELHQRACDVLVSMIAKDEAAINTQIARPLARSEVAKPAQVLATVLPVLHQRLGYLGE